MFTKLQVEEIVPLIDIRMDTVEDDPESGSGIELIEGALARLKEKIENGVDDFSYGEIEFLIEELENRIGIANANRSYEDERKINAFIKSMQNAIDKLKKQQ